MTITKSLKVTATSTDELCLSDQEVLEVMGILKFHPLANEVQTTDNVVYVITNENPDDETDHTFPAVLDMLGLKWDSNDCEGCYNEYMIYSVK